MSCYSHSFFLSSPSPLTRTYISLLSTSLTSSLLPTPTPPVAMATIARHVIANEYSLADESVKTVSDSHESTPHSEDLSRTRLEESGREDSPSSTSSGQEPCDSTVVSTNSHTVVLWVNLMLNWHMIMHNYTVLLYLLVGVIKNKPILTFTCTNLCTWITCTVKLFLDIMYRFFSLLATVISLKGNLLFNTYSPHCSHTILHVGVRYTCICSYFFFCHDWCISFPAPLDQSHPESYMGAPMDAIAEEPSGEDSTSNEGSEHNLAEPADSADNIKLQRVTGVSVRHTKPPPASVIKEGWMVHYTNKSILVSGYFMKIQ